MKTLENLVTISKFFNFFWVSRLYFEDTSYSMFYISIIFVCPNISIVFI